MSEDAQCESFGVRENKACSPGTDRFPGDMTGNKARTCFSFTLTVDQAEHLRQICLRRGFESYDVQYSQFAFRGDHLNLVCYRTGKLVIQGQGAQEFVTFTVEQEVTQTFFTGNEEVYHPEWYEAHAGLDESGKGDFFGPVITACVIAGGDEVRALQKVGVKDSKAVSSDKIILELEKKIRGTLGIIVEVMALSMEKYNELYIKFGQNLNQLLGWMHSCSLKNALKRRFVERGLLDQFSKRPIVQGFLRGTFPGFTLAMRTKAEEDPVVAAASIIARAEYVRRMEVLSREAGIPLPKGAGVRVNQVGRELYEKVGEAGLVHFCKLHFKNREALVE